MSFVFRIHLISKRHRPLIEGANEMAWFFLFNDIQHISHEAVHRINGLAGWGSHFPHREKDLINQRMRVNDVHRRFIQWLLQNRGWRDRLGLFRRLLRGIGIKKGLLSGIASHGGGSCLRKF